MEPVIRPVLVLIILAAFVPVTAAQQVELLGLEVEVSESLVVVPLGGVGPFVVTVTDRSNDGTGNIPGGPAAGLVHTVTFEVEGDQPRGWSMNIPPSRVINSGQSIDFQFRFLSTQAVGNPYYPVTIGVILSGNGESIRHNLTVTAYSPGRDGFNAQVSSSFQVAPEQIESVPLKITNIGLYPRTFDLAVGDNPCGVGIVPPSSILVAGKSTLEISISLQGPTDKIWYFTEACSITLRLIPQDNPNIDQTVILGGQVNGGYFNPVWAFWAVAIVLAAILLFFFIAGRKARIEEELLGKPQRPWTIPVEAVYLKHLKERDPRAHYVVRHFLMEEEYQSSLLWYKEFKHATRGGRSKERLVVAQEHKLERFEKRWKRRLAHPLLLADRLESKLQKKLDRKGKGSLRKQHRNWRKITKKMQAAHEAKVSKATEKWEKQAAKAAKKGKPAPEAPTFATPDYPIEPSLDRLLLADHKWNKKAERFRRKQVKRQGNLEVKFERKEARLLRKVRRRVEKVARKLDDPDFAAEHPMLGGKSAAKAARKQH